METLPLRRINRRERSSKFSLRAARSVSWPTTIRYWPKAFSWIFSALRRVRRRDWLDLLYIPMLPWSRGFFTGTKSSANTGFALNPQSNSFALVTT